LVIHFMIKAGKKLERGKMGAVWYKGLLGRKDPNDICFSNYSYYSPICVRKYYWCAFKFPFDNF